MEVGSETVIKVSMKTALWSACALAGLLVAGIWVVALFVLGEVKDDVRTIREDVSELRGVTDSKTTMLVSADGDLSKTLADLVAQLEINNQRLLDLSEKLGQVDDRLTVSITRQQQFEQYVVTRLPSPTSLPEGWSSSQDAIVSLIASGKVDPLVTWFDTIAPIEK